MNLRQALDLCTANHAHEWVEIPTGQWGRPATSMLAGLVDPGSSEPLVRPLAGHSVAIYEPDPRLSMVWPVPEESEEDREPGLERVVPEWIENDDHDWSYPPRSGWVMILLGGAPIWQSLIWYLSWGSGLGGYVPDFQPRFGERDDDGRPSLDGWDVSEWAVGLARLVNGFSHLSQQWAPLDPTLRIAPSPGRLHPLDA